MDEKYLNATCKICGKKYHVCGDCKSQKTITPWRNVVDSVNCWKIYYALVNYTNGSTNADDTKEILSRCDLSELDSFKDNIKKTINKLMGVNSTASTCTDEVVINEEKKKVAKKMQPKSKTQKRTKVEIVTSDSDVLDPYETITTKSETELGDDAVKSEKDNE